jgi:FG-GAP-like repeat
MALFRARNAVWLVAFTISLSSTAARAVEIVGTQATVGWTPASGPVAGYYVIVSRNAQPAKVESITIDTKKTLTGSLGETLVVSVAAFAQDGVAGPVSPSSNPITFVSGSSGGGTTPPPPDGGGTTPPPDGGTPPPPTDTSVPVERDFNGDGTADLLVTAGSSVSIWTMHGGVVASEIPLPALPTAGRVVGTGDYDGNLTADVLWENSETHALTLWFLNGGAVLSNRSLDRSSLPPGEEWHVGGSADFDGDGADDLMLFSRVKGEVEIWTFSGTSVATRTRLPGHKGAWSVAAVDDTDGDGKAEIVWLDELKRSLELRDPAASGPVALGELGAGWRVRGGVDLAGDGSAELVLVNSATGATQDWAIDDTGVLGSGNLPSSQSLGRFAGGGDFDGDGSQDVAWSDVFDRAVTLWLSTSGTPTSVVVDRALPAGGEVVSGNTASDESEFRRRLCSGDLDGNGTINSQDFQVLKQCLNKARTPACDLADMDSDGWVTRTKDFDIFKLRFTGTRCEAW